MADALQREYVWSTDDPDADRLVWSPAVHEHFNERCYFYLISGRRAETKGSMSDDIRRTLISLEIRSATVHAVFGTYDLIVRFWGTGPARQRFLRGLKQSSLDIHTIREFTAEDVQYGTSRQMSPSAADIRSIKPEIERLVAKEREAPGAPLEATDSASLIQGGFASPIEPGRGVKFYVFMSSQQGRSSQPADFVSGQLSQLVSSINSAEAYRDRNLSLRSVSVYSGIGFADYILKAVAPNYDSLLDFANDIRRRAKELRLDPWTLPVADYGHRGAIAAETVDAIEGDLAPEVDALIAALDRDEEIQQRIRREIASMRRDERRALALLLDRMRPRLSGTDLERLDETVAACLLLSRKDLNRAASFVTSIEDDLRFFVPRFLSYHLGKNWLALLNDAGFERSLQLPDPAEQGAGQALKPGSGPADWSLYTLLRALAFSYSTFGGNLAADLVAKFPDGWRKNIRAIVNLRDDFAHGKMMTYAREGRYDGLLGEKLEALVVASGFQLALEREVDEMRNSQA